MPQVASRKPAGSEEEASGKPRAAFRRGSVLGKYRPDFYIRIGNIDSSIWGVRV